MNDEFKKRKAIVIVDDDNMLLDMYCARLEMEDYAVHIARDGKEGYRVITEEHPDVIITDLMMPKEDGFGLTEKIKKNAKVKDIPIIVFTNLDADEDKRRALGNGAALYLVKSHTTPSELIESIKKLIN